MIPLMMQRCLRLISLGAALWLFAGQALANNLLVSNVGFTNTIKDAGFTEISFDLSWENSWHASWIETDTGVGNPALSLTNWDAAWIFIKYRLRSGANTGWQHVYLAPEGHVAPAGITITPGLTDGTNVGVFIHRNSHGHGKLEIPRLRLRWDYAAQNLHYTNPLDISVQAIEMVYVPAGPFYVGDGGREENKFTDGSWSSGNSIPFRITNEAPLEIKKEPGYLWGIGSYIEASTLSYDFPKGADAFYCMKYEITQEQYANFLNHLSATQADALKLNSMSSRQSISGTWPNYTAAAPDRAANYLSGKGWAAYAAWAGLRPLTELEFEKACRGPKAPLDNEFAWGTASAVQQTGHTGMDGSGLEGAAPPDANLLYGNGPIKGPVRVGVYATDSSDRERAGASYWGILDLSGNNWERTITVAHANGRAFQGTLGSGSLENDGSAPNADWRPQASGSRGGSWYTVIAGSYVSSRRSAGNISYPHGENWTGGRGGRQAP